MLIEHYGGIWRLTKKNYRRLLQHAAEGNEWILDDFGNYIGNIELDVTDLTAEQAKDELAQIHPTNPK